MRRLSVCLTVLFFLLLLLFPSSAIEGAENGLLLWFQRVIPSLLPFALVSHLLAETNLSEAFSPRLCVILMGFACGYPMGAVWASALSQRGKLTKEEGEELLLCNQPSPMFLSGYLGIQSLKLRQTLPLLLCAYLPPLLYLLFQQGSWGKKEKASVSFRPLSIGIFERAWMESCQILVKIGGYMMLFSILAAVMSDFLAGRDLLKANVIALFEMTTGIRLLSETGLPLPIKGGLCLFFACFGGLSVLLQTLSCLEEGPLTGRSYLWKKLLFSALSAIIYYIWLNGFSCR